MRNGMDLVNLAAFVVVAEKLSFVDASKVLNISPSALSRRIQKLEESLGAVLLTRTTRDVGLTTAGRVLLERSLPLLAEVDEIAIAFRGQPALRSQTVSIACLPSSTRCFIVSVLKQVRKLHPELKINLLDGTASEVLDAIRSQEVDFGINYMGSAEAGLEFQRFFDDTFVLAVSAHHRLSQRATVSWEEIQSERVILVRKATGIRMLIDAGLAKAGKQVRWAYEVRHAEMALSLVEAGLGVAVVPQTVLLAAAKHDIVGPELVDPCISRSVGLVRLGNKPLRPIAHEVWELAAEELTNHSKKLPREARGAEPARTRPAGKSVVARGAELTPAPAAEPA